MKKSGLRSFQIKSILVCSFLLILMSSLPLGAYEITIRVAILMNQQAVKFYCPKELVVRNARNLEKVGKSGATRVIRVHSGKIYVDKDPVDSKYVYVTTVDYHTPISVNGVNYRGYYLVGLNDRGGLMVVNHIGMEDYLAGVLGGEIIASWPAESIKAQAVAARTYVLYKMRNNKNRLYDVVNDTADQMYIGVRGEASTFTRAVEETRGQVLARDGRPICAYYHSNSGGHTSDSSKVFKEDKGALKGVKDSYSLGAPNSTWQLKLTSNTILNRLRSQLGGATRLFSIKPHSRDEAGRITYLEIEHDKGKTLVFGSDFRRLIGYNVLKSTKFDLHPQEYYSYRYSRKVASRGIKPDEKGVYTNESIDQVKVEDLKIPGVYYISGSGWGHGVGMSQWGARGMANNGADYRQILMHYYPGTQISIARAK